MESAYRFACSRKTTFIQRDRARRQLATAKGAELVFNTGMTGGPELTDPSRGGQFRWSKGPRYHHVQGRRARAAREPESDVHASVWLRARPARQRWAPECRGTTGRGLRGKRFLRYMVGLSFIQRRFVIVGPCSVVSRSMVERRLGGCLRRPEH